MQINLNANLVAAICQFKAKEDIRYYLEGVYVAPLESGGAVIVATNGHALGLWRDLTGQVERPAILRIEKKLESACAGKGERHLRLIDGRLTVVDEHGLELFVQHREGNKPESWEIEAKYPDWKAVIPKGTSGPALFDGMNPTYVGFAQKALAIAKGKDYLGLAFHQAAAENGIAVICDREPNFMAVIMPMRESTGMFPEWISALLPVVAEQPEKELVPA